MSKTQVKDMGSSSTGTGTGTGTGTRTATTPKPATKISNHSISAEQVTKINMTSKQKKSPVQIKKGSYVNEISSVKLRKLKSDFTNTKSEGVSLKLRKVKSETSKNLHGSLMEKTEDSIHHKEIVRDSNADLEDTKPRSDQEFGLDNLGQNQIIKSQPNVDFVGGEEEEEDDGEEEVEEEVEVEDEKRILDIKDIKVNVEEKKEKEPVIEEKKLIQNNENPEPISSTVKKQPVIHAKVVPNLTKTKPVPVSNNFHGNRRNQSKLQSFVDLIMWRDVSKSAFIFGIGSFALISSSYTKDLNISLISVVSYLGLIYLAVNFLLKSLIPREGIDMQKRKQDYVVGEEEIVWIIRLILPYLNEFLLKFRALFSGDPATTLKLALLLFILARCGPSLTIWKMARLGFFGVFTVPKVCSAYSSQLNAYGNFWIQRFGDAWESCTHKKAVGFGIFTLVWNMSSVVARIWAVFILFVAFKYYQQFWIKEESIQEESTTQENPRSTILEIRKQKKHC